jgi:arylformamidase
MQWVKTLEAGDNCNNSCFSSDIHVGTHVDAPFHFTTAGKTVEQLDLNVLIGPAVVAYLPDVEAISAGDLAFLDLPDDTERLILHTRNSQLWNSDERMFHEDYVGLTADAAHWIVDRGIHLVGVDYLSVQRFCDGPEVHQILLGAGVVVVEGLNLSGVAPDNYEFICLPLKIFGAEGAPARAVLRAS